MDAELREQLYTLRWHVRQQTGESTNAALDILSEILGEKSTIPAPLPQAGHKEPAGANLLWVPFADRVEPLSHTRGTYDKGYPQGAVVHFTAGHREQSIKDALAYQVKQGYTYFFIDQAGKIGQNFPLNEWGYHAGESKWPGLGSSVHKQLVGIEIACGGELDKNRKTWFGKTIAEDQTRKVPGIANMEEGVYQIYTAAQEASLLKLLLWLYSNNPKTFKLDYVLGHDEVSGPRGLGWRRKNDPGGALSMTMDKLRETLKEKSK